MSMPLQQLLLLVTLHFLPVGVLVMGMTSMEAFATADSKEIRNFTPPRLYHSSDVVLAKVQELVSRHGEILSLEELSAEADGYSAEIRVVTFQLGSNNVTSAEKWRLLLDFGQHGRELVTTEVALRLLSILAGEYSSVSLSSARLQHVLTNSIIKIIPMENVNGRKKVEAGDFCERKNGRGVDTNRNWGLDWGKKEKDYDPAEEYPGASPFSEPETRMVKELAQKFNPHVWVNVHSGMEALFMPYDHKMEGPGDGSREPMMMLLQTINSLHCRNSCVVGSGGGSVGYLAHGTATDFMFDTLRVPIALTFEIFGDSSASSEACFQMFNPVTADRLEQVVSKWSAAFITLLLNFPSALKSLPGRMWSQARQIDWSRDLHVDLEVADREAKSSLTGTIWPGMDTGRANVLGLLETEQAMHQLVTSLYVLWGCVLLLACATLGCRWKRLLAGNVDRKPIILV